MVVVGKITSIGPLNERITCHKCYSLNVTRENQTVKCDSWKPRSLYSHYDPSQNEIKVDIIDQSGNLFELTVSVSNIHLLLKEMNRTDLCEQDLI